MNHSDLNIIFQTSNRQERVQLLVIEHWHPIFGYEWTDIEHSSTHNSYYNEKGSMFSIKLLYFQICQQNKENDLENSTPNANSLALLASGDTVGLSTDTMGSTFGNFFLSNFAQVAKTTLTFTVESWYRYSSCSKEVFAGSDLLGRTYTKMKQEFWVQNIEFYLGRVFT